MTFWLSPLGVLLASISGGLACCSMSCEVQMAPPPKKDLTPDVNSA